MKNTLKPLHWLAIVAVAGACAIAAYLALGGNAPKAPTVTYALLDGSQKTTDQLKGKVYLVNFWATSCVTCVKEMPEMVRTFEKFKGRGFEHVAVAMKYDPPAFVKSFADSRKLPFMVAIDNTGMVAKSWNDTQLTPTTYLVDKQGRVVKRYVGEPDFKALHALIEQLLAA